MRGREAKHRPHTRIRGDQAFLWLTWSLLFHICLSGRVYPQETSHAEVVTVVVVGEASGGSQSTIEEVERQAWEDAVRKAVEQVAGVYVTSETTVSMGAVSKDEILSWAQGLVKVLEVVDTQTDYDADFKAFRCRKRIRAEVRARETRELLARVGREQEAQARQSEPTSFIYEFRGRRKQADGTWLPLTISERGEVRSGDQIQIAFEAKQDCYAYVINQDASGQVFVLFPHEEAISNALTAGLEYVLPDRGKFYELDDVVGEETFYLAVSRTPMSDLEWMIRRTKRGEDPSATAMLNGTLRARGLRAASRIVSDSDGSVSAPTGRVAGAGAMVEVVTITHR